jgi:hypothetical protein
MGDRSRYPGTGSKRLVRLSLRFQRGVHGLAARPASVHRKLVELHGRPTDVIFPSDTHSHQRKAISASQPFAISWQPSELARCPSCEVIVLQSLLTPRPGLTCS